VKKQAEEEQALKFEQMREKWELDMNMHME
jgi:hypothetical protein